MHVPVQLKFRFGIEFLIKAVVVSVIFILSGCTKDGETIQPDLGYNYFPVYNGHEAIYHVDSVYRDPFFGTYSYVSYQVKEITDSVFLDNQGRETFRISRYRNDSLSATPYWYITNVWTANRTTTTAERFENNIRYIRLIFPVVSGKTWNGNSMNNLGEQEYYITSANQQESINSLLFDSVAHIIQFNDTAFNLLFPRYEFEKYAKGAGLMHKYIRQIDYTYNQQTGQFDTSRYLLYEEKLLSYQ